MSGYYGRLSLTGLRIRPVRALLRPTTDGPIPSCLCPPPAASIAPCGRQSALHRADSARRLRTPPPPPPHCDLQRRQAGFPMSATSPLTQLEEQTRSAGRSRFHPCESETRRPSIPLTRTNWHAGGTV